MYKISEEQAGQRLAGLWKPIIPTKMPFNNITIAYVSPLTKSNKMEYILVAIDNSTCFVIAQETLYYMTST